MKIKNDFSASGNTNVGQVVSLVSVCDNEFVRGGHEIERMLVTQETQEILDKFRALRG
jgi:hypothetical protein